MREVISEILSNIGSLDVDEIKEKLNSHLIGMAVSTPLIPPGENFYRGRRLEQGFEKSDAKNIKNISYNIENIPLGRANRAGHPVFYCSNFRDAIFYEIKELNVGDEIILGYWENSKRILVNSIGYTKFVFESLGAERELPQWLNNGDNTESLTLPSVNQTNEELEEIKVRDDNREIREILSELYTNREPNYYKLTTAIAELHLGEIRNNEIKFGGVMYPSVQMNARGDNLAIMPWVIDDGHLLFKKALHYRIDMKNADGIHCAIVDWATADENGNLNWKGHAPQWQTRFQGDHLQLTLEEGVDEDGSYTVSSEGKICHWVCRDVNGNIIERT